MLKFPIFHIGDITQIILVQYIAAQNIIRYTERTGCFTQALIISEDNTSNEIFYLNLPIAGCPLANKLFNIKQ